MNKSIYIPKKYLYIDKWNHKRPLLKILRAWNKTINPNVEDISNIIEQSKYIFNSIEYNIYEHYFYLILKIFPTKEQSSIEIRIEITKEKVLIFNGELRKEKIFQLDISQNEQNSFYIIE